MSLIVAILAFLAGFASKLKRCRPIKNIFRPSPIKRRQGVFNMRKKMTLFPKPNSPNLQYGADGDAGRSVFLRPICR